MFPIYVIEMQFLLIKTETERKKEKEDAGISLVKMNPHGAPCRVDTN